MRKRSDTARHTGRKNRAGRRTRTDWKKVDAMTEAALEASIAADPDDVHEGG